MSGQFDLGSASGKVRIEYESAGGDKLLSEMQRLEQQSAKTAKTWQASAKDIGLQGNAITQLTKIQQAHAQAVKISAMFEANLAATRRNSSSSLRDIHRQETLAAKARRSVADMTRVLSQQNAQMGSQLAVEGSKAATQFATGFKAAGVAKAAVAAKAVGGALAAGLSAALVAGIAAATAAVAAAVAGIAYTFQKGFERSVSLDTATYKMKALGKTTAETAAIMKSALDSVKGTQYGLDQAATVAAAATAAGVKPGQSLTTYLRLVADTAAVTGRSLEDMGSKFNSIQANNVAFLGDLRELGDAGIPIFEALQKEYGVSGAELKKMVDRGEVDAQRFLNAMESAVGGAALVMGDSFTGSVANLNAAVSRIGQALIKPIFSGSSNWIKGLTNELGKLEDWLAANEDKVIGFWYQFGKVVLQTGQIIWSTMSFITNAIVQVTESLGDLGGWAVRAFAWMADVTGFDGTAKDANELADSLHNLGSGIRANRDANNKSVYDFFDRMNNSLEDWKNNSLAAANASDEVTDAFRAGTEATQPLSQALEDLGVQSDAAIKGIEGTTAEFNDLLDVLAKNDAAQDVVDTIKEIRRQFEGGGRQVRNFAEAIENFADSTADADSAAKDLLDSLKELGVLPGYDAIDKYNEKFREFTEYNADNVNSLDDLGAALIDVNGEINTTSETGSKLEKAFDDIRQAAVAAAQEGADADSVWENTSAAMRARLADVGIVGPAAEDIINKYLLPKDKFKELIASAGDPVAALESLFKDNPAKLNTLLNLLTTQENLLTQLLGPDGQLIVPTVLDVEELRQREISEIDTQDEYKRWINEGAGIPNPPAGNGTPTTIPFPNVPDRGQTGPQLNLPPTSTPPKDLDDILNQISGGAYGLTPEQTDKAGELFADSDAIRKILADRPDLAAILNDVVAQAEQQGGNFAYAFAQGILSGTDDVKRALLEIAQMAPDILGSSPAKYGPLSGKGWTYYRGKTFTVAFADGIASEQDSVKSSATGVAGGAAGSLEESFAKWLQDMNELSGFGQSILQLVESVSDIFIGIMEVGQQLSGGTLFPKLYQKDPKKAEEAARRRAREEQLGGARGVSRSGTAEPEVVADLGGGKTVPLVQNPDGTWTSTDPEWAKLIARESSGVNQVQSPNTVDVNTGGNEAEGLFQITPKTWAANGGTQFAPSAIAATPQQQAIIAARILQGNPSGSDWGAGLPGRENAEALLAGLTGGGTTPTVTTPRPTGAAPEGMTWDEKSGKWVSVGDYFSGNTRTVAAVNLPSGGSQSTNPAIGLLEMYAKEMGLTLTSGKRDWAGTSSGTSYHLSGEAGDFAVPGVNVPTENKRKFAEFVRDNFAPYISELIYSDDAGGVNLLDGQPFTYGASTQAQHRNHVHVAIRDAMIDAIQTQGLIPPGSVPTATTDLLNNIDGNTSSLADNTSGFPALVTEMAKGDQTLTEAMQAAKGGLQVDDPTAQGYLQHLDRLIAQQNALGTMQGDDTAAVLGDIRNGIMERQGLVEGPDMLGQITNFASAATGIAGSVFDVIDSSIEAIGGAKSISGTLVRGIENTESINKIVDGLQPFLSLAVSIGGLTSDILGLASGIVGSASTGAAAGGDMGGTAAAAAALGAASSIAGIVTSVISAWNATIDLVQEGYRLVTKYVGRAMLNLFGMPSATDINYLLDTITGELKIYSSENPDYKTTWQTPGNRYETRTGPSNSFYIYQGPGQDPRDTMNDAMFAVRSSGMGVFGYGE